MDTPNAVQCPAGTFAYTIVSGDTLYSLAVRYGTTVQAIVAVNPGINPNFLQIGQVICIPRTTTPPTTCPPNTFSYTITASDTLYSLAIRYNTTVQAILAANPGLNPNFLQIGQVICIPRTTTPPVSCPPNTVSYTISAGDTLYSIAQRYGTTVQAILAVNPGLNPNFLQIGQVICVPRAVTPPVSCPPGTFSYTIRSGDTLYSLAVRYNTTVQAIISANPGINPNFLQVGQAICIPLPTPTACPPGTTTYIVQRGDTFYSIALRYNITVQALINANPGVNPNTLQIGQRLCIPSR